MEEVKLIGAFPSPFVYRIIWALKLKGIDFEFVEESLTNKSDLLLKYNPVHKKVPVLVHGGKPIAESTVILEYIDEKWPETHPLLPRDPYERARARFWIKFIDDKGHLLFAAMSAPPNGRQAKVEEVRQVLKILEDQGLAGGTKFFGGDDIGMADLVLGFTAHWFEVIEAACGMTVIGDEFPRLVAWMDNFKQVPVIKENSPDSEKMLSVIRRIMGPPQA